VNSLLKLGVGLIGFIVLYGLAAPIAFFVTDLIQDPELLRVQMAATQVNESAVRLVVTVYYNGSVELKDVKLVVLGSTLFFGDLAKGANVSRSIIVPISKLPEVGKELIISFSVVGLYPVELRIRGAS